MTEHYALMVPGATATGNVAVTAPYDDAPIATVDTADADAVDTALATAHRLFRDRAGWLTRTAAPRSSSAPPRSWPSAPSTWPSRRRAKAASR